MDKPEGFILNPPQLVLRHIVRGQPALQLARGTTFAEVGNTGPNPLQHRSGKDLRQAKAHLQHRNQQKTQRNHPPEKHGQRREV